MNKREQCRQEAIAAWHSTMDDAADEVYRAFRNLLVEGLIEGGACVAVAINNPTFVMPGIGQVTSGSFLVGCWGLVAGRGLYNLWNARAEFQIDSDNADAAFYARDTLCIDKTFAPLSNAQQTRDRALHDNERDYLLGVISF